jgi:hypothetical protein
MLGGVEEQLQSFVASALVSEICEVFQIPVVMFSVVGHTPVESYPQRQLYSQYHSDFLKKAAFRPENKPPSKMYSAFGKSLCTYKRCWKSIERTLYISNQLDVILVSFSLYFLQLCMFRAFLAHIQELFAALVAVGLKNECVLVWCGV